MQWKEFFKPSKLTWVIFGIIVLILIVNGIILNTFYFGIEALVMIPFYLPLIIFRSIGLSVTTGYGFFPSPNMLGYILILLFNLIVIYLISLILNKIFTKINQKFFP
jgi:hypothetical protein